MIGDWCGGQWVQLLMSTRRWWCVLVVAGRGGAAARRAGEHRGAGAGVPQAAAAGRHGGGGGALAGAGRAVPGPGEQGEDDLASLHRALVLSSRWQGSRGRQARHPALVLDQRLRCFLPRTAAAAPPCRPTPSTRRPFSRTATCSTTGATSASSGCAWAWCALAWAVVGEPTATPSLGRPAPCCAVTGRCCVVCAWWRCCTVRHAVHLHRHHLPQAGRLVAGHVLARLAALLRRGESVPPPTTRSPTLSGLAWKRSSMQRAVLEQVLLFFDKVAPRRPAHPWPNSLRRLLPAPRHSTLSTPTRAPRRPS